MLTCATLDSGGLAGTDRSCSQDAVAAASTLPRAAMSSSIEDIADDDQDAEGEEDPSLSKVGYGEAEASQRSTQSCKGRVKKKVSVTTEMEWSEDA